MGESVLALAERRGYHQVSRTEADLCLGRHHRPLSAVPVLGDRDLTSDMLPDLLAITGPGRC